MDESFKEEFLQCPICMNEFENPKSLLPCQHTLCKECLRTYIMNSTVKQNRHYGIRCPICQSFVQIPNQRKPRVQWADEFPDNFVFSSMLDSLRKAEASGSGACGLSSYLNSQKCKDHDKPLRIYCRTDSILICSVCLSERHKECQWSTERDIRSGLNSVLSEIDSLTDTFRSIKEGFSSDGKLREEEKNLISFIEKIYAIKDNLPQCYVLHMSRADMTKIVIEMFENERQQLNSKRQKCESCIEDALSCLNQARSKSDDSVEISEMCVITDVAQGMAKFLTEQLKEVEVPGGFDLRMKAYIRSLMSPALPDQGSTSALEMKAIPFPSGDKLRMHRVDSFNAKIPNDARNCFITGIAVLSTDGNIIVADQNNSKLKMFSDSFNFICELPLLSPPFDVAETGTSRIAVTFGEKSVVHLYEIGASITSNFQPISTDQPCYGITAGSGLVFIFCDNLILSPACVKVYDYNMKILYKIAHDLFSTSEYLDFCPVSGRLYISTHCLTYRALVCFSEEGEEIWRQQIIGAIPKGIVAVPNGVMVVNRPRFQMFNEDRPSIFWLSSSVGSARNAINTRKGIKRTPLPYSEVGFARTIATNKQRTVLVVSQEVPLVSLASNNEIRVFRIQR